MGIYYPPKTGLKGVRPEHWGGGVIPDNLANAIATAQLVNKEAIFDSGSEWLILDANGATPSIVNMDIQPVSQLIRADYYGARSTAPTQIDITNSKGFLPSRIPPYQGWFSHNWKWALPAAALAILIVTPGK